MKKRILLLTVTLGIAYITLTSSHLGGGLIYGADGTSASGTTNSCGRPGCHTSLTSTSVVLELDSVGIPVSHYVAGHSYTIKVTGTNTSSTLTLPKFGFQLAVVKSVGAGTSSAVMTGALQSTGLPASVQYTTMASSGLPFDVVEQSTQIAATTGTGGIGTTYVESIGWTAPVSGTGTVKIYGCVNAVNFNSAVTGDAYNSAAALTITELLPPAVAPITGTITVCVGATTTLNDATSGGVWSSASTGIATVSTIGVVTGVAAGTVVISYNAGTSGIATTTVTVNTVPPTPAAIMGSLTGGIPAICVGGTTTVTDATVGGVWSSSNSTIASINSAGVITGVSGGTATISYTVSNACGSSYTINSVVVNTPPTTPPPPVGTTSICVGSTSTLTDIGGGTWSSSATTIATVSSSGLVTGISAGTANITFTVTNLCGSSFSTSTVTINPLPVYPTITGGTSSICVGATTTFTDITSGGIWSISNSTIATINTSGVVTGVSAGIDTINYSVSNSCATVTASTIITINTSPAAGSITGLSTVCIGANITLADLVSGGTWSSSSTNASISTIGVVTGLLGGTATISYTVSNTCGSSYATHAVVVNTPPSTPPPPVGTTSICVGTTSSLIDVVGGTWSSSASTIATVSSSGLVTGISAGTANITFTVTNLCGSSFSTTTVTINPLPTFPTITGGTSSMCVGATTTFTDIISGGVWSSTNTSIATVNTAGIVTGVSVGIDTIKYTVSNSCGTLTASTIITITSSPTAGTITGSSTVCLGSNITLADLVGGGTWSSNNTNASVSTTGVVTGLTGGVDTITYSVSSTCGSASTFKIITVGIPPVSGIITGPGSVCVGVNITLSESIFGGIWTSGSAIATVSGSGVVTGISAGTVIISYSVSNSCGSSVTTTTITVEPLPSIPIISGIHNICAGLTTTLTASIAGGTWSSVFTSVATVNSSGIVTGGLIGVDTIYYSVIEACGTGNASFIITVNVAPSSAGVIIGPDSICITHIITLTDGISGGTWSSSGTNATVSPTGVASGMNVGVDTIFYTISNICGSISAFHVVYVLAPSPTCIPLGVYNIAIGANDKIYVYPNPSNGIFTIELPELKNDATLLISDLIGHVLETKAINATSNLKAKYDFSNLPKGCYLIKLIAENNTYREKLIIN